jgi:long-chain acyl-CoA synthetase
MDESGRLAQSLKRRGLRSGDRVVLHMSNRPEYVIAYCACLRLGAISAPLSTRLKSPELREQIRRLQPSIYLGEPDLYAQLNVDDSMPILPDHTYLLGECNGLKAARPWSLLTQGGEKLERCTEVDRDQPVALLETSGTTARSKLVIYTPAMLAALRISAGPRGFTQEDVIPCCTPLYHASGFTTMCYSFLLGAPYVLPPSLESAAILDTLEEKKCTVFFGLPFRCAEVSQLQQQEPRNLPALRSAFVTGDACAKSVEEQFERAFKLRLPSIWAATEDPGATAPGRLVGPFINCLPDTGIRIVDEVGEDVSKGRTGRMLLRSPTTTPGYWESSENVELLPDRWLDTGDLVRQEVDGQYRFLGRQKDVIVRGDANVSPVEVETVFREHASVLDAAVAGIADEVLGQRVGIAIVVKDPNDPSVIDNVFRFAAQTLAEYKLPEKFILVDSIPHNPLGKVDRGLLEALLRDTGGDLKVNRSE